MSWLYFAERFLIALLAKACTGAPGVLASAGFTWLSIRQSSVRNAGGGSAMISNSFGEEFGWQATKFSARNPTGRLNNFRRVPPRGPLRKQGLVELGLEERFSCFAASQAAQRNSPRLLAEILTFGRAPRGGTRRKLLSLPAGFLAEKFVACQPNSSPKELLIIADPPPAFLTDLCLIDSQVHPALASTPGAPVHALASNAIKKLSSCENGPWDFEWPAK